MTFAAGEMTDPSEMRLEKLEFELAHLNRLYDQLNEVVTEQAMRLDSQSRTIRRLTDQLNELKEKPLPMSDPLDEKPPHY